MNKKIIEVSNLNFENVLTSISLEIFEGDFIAILGPNGGGKTTFIKLLLNILKQNSGEIKFQENLKNKIGYVPQSATTVDGVFPATVDEIIKTAFVNKKSFFKKISIEDKNFYKHQGFDFLRIFKALMINFKSGKNMQGASTITQQYSKNKFFIRICRKSYWRKRRRTKDYRMLSKFAYRINRSKFHKNINKWRRECKI
jgi:ABC-type sugar transport system ATPase subunit